MSLAGVLALPGRRLAIAGAWLASIALVGAQDGTITISSPMSDDIIRAGDKFFVIFEALGGVAPPYDIDLFRRGEQVSSWCSDSKGCDVPNGSVSVSLSQTQQAGAGYSVRVTEQSSSVFGISATFTILANNTTYAEDFEDVGAGGSVGDMDMGMMVVASICGVALVGVLMAACLIARRRRAASAEKAGMTGVGDIEHGRDGSTRDKSPTPSPTRDRGYGAASSMKGGPSLMSSHPYTMSPMPGESEIDKFRSPGTALARGDRQRSRSLSRSLSRDRLALDSGGKRSRGRARGRSGSKTDEEGPRMYSGQDDQGPRMYPSHGTPGRDKTPPVMVSTTPSRHTPGRNTPDSGGRRIVARGGSNRENWEEPYRRGHSASPSQERSYSPRGRVIRPQSRSVERPMRPPRSAQQPYTDQEFSGNNHGRSGRGAGRSEHVLGYRRSLSVGRNTPPSRDSENWEEEVLRRRAERPTAGATSEMRRGRGGDHTSSSAGRRSKSNSSRGDYSSPDPFDNDAGGYAYEGSRRDGSRRRGDPSPSSSRQSPYRSNLPSGERQERSSRRRSKEVHNFSPGEVARFETEQSAGGSSRSRGERSWASSRQHGSSSPSPGRHQSPYRSGMALPSPQDVSWEELRSRHHRSRGRSRTPRPEELPTYSEVAAHSPASLDSGSRTAGSGTTSGSHRAPPPSYQQTLTPDGGQLSIGLPGDQNEPFRSAQSARSARSSRSSRSKSASSKKPISRAVSTGEVTTSTRAISARRAARDAQESAERALAAAAAASRAADLAAQAAIEAEAEADAELRSVAEGGESVQGGDGESVQDGETPVLGYSPPAPTSASNASVRHNAGAFGSGSGRYGSGSGKTRAWSGADEEEIKERAERAAERAQEALEVMGRTGATNTRPDNSWVTNRIGGPDTAGGSGGGGSGGGGSGGERGAGKGTRAGPLLPPSSYRSVDELNAKRRQFVKQYSGSSTYDGESDYSLHDNPPVVPSRRPFISQDSGLTSFDGSEYSVGEGVPINAAAQRPEPPESPERPSSSSAKKRQSPGRLPSFKPRARTRKGPSSAAVKNMSEAGSSPEDAAYA